MTTHAGLEPEKGFSACTELAYKLTKISKLSDLSTNLNLNPGVISGGVKPNIVCEHATSKIE
jgi:glutamate carboxypeptidase